MCDKDMMLNYIDSLPESDVKEACLNTLSNPSIDSNCACWSGLDQDWVYDNFHCKWNEDDEETLIDDYNKYCLAERTSLLFFVSIGK